MEAAAVANSRFRPWFVDIFRARCEARAALVAGGEMDLIEAADGLQEIAESQGIIDAVGQDAVQAIMAEAFAMPGRPE